MLAAVALADGVVGVSARDLLHASVMARRGCTRIVSADKDFERMPGLIRLDPALVADWEGSLVG